MFFFEKLNTWNGKAKRLPLQFNKGCCFAAEEDRSQGQTHLQFSLNTQVNFESVGKVREAKTAETFDVQGMARLAPCKKTPGSGSNRKKILDKTKKKMKMLASNSGPTKY